MKKLTRIKALLLAAVMLVSLAPASVYAQKGPFKDFKKGNSFIALINTTNTKIDYVFNNDGKVSKIKGVSYSAKTNTLTLNNFNNAKFELDIKNMGEDFKINVKGTNKLCIISHYAERKLGAGIKITGKGKLEVNKKKNFLNAISVGSTGGKNSVVIAPSVKLNAYYPAGGNKIAVIDTILEQNKAVSYKAAKKIDPMQSYYVDGTSHAWVPVSKGRYSNTEKYYSAKIKKSGKKCYIRITKVGKKKAYWVMTKYTKTSKLGIVGSILNTHTKVFEDKKALTDYCKVDFSKKHKGYVIDLSFDLDYYTKNGTDKYIANYYPEEHCYKVFKVTNQKLLGHVTGTYVESLKVKGYDDALEAAGYLPMYTQTPIYTYCVK